MKLEEKIGRYMRRKVVFAQPTSTLREVASLMAKEGTDVVVVGSEREVAGMITAAELFDALRSYILGRDLLENIPPDLREIQVDALMRSRRAMDFMDVCGLTGTRLCINVRADDIVANAVRVMAMVGTSHLLVTDGGRVVGTLCAEDLVKAFLT